MYKPEPSLPKTKYAYCEEMRDLCLRLTKALCALEGQKSVLADVYSSAEEGFYIRLVRMSVEEASRPVAEERIKRLQDFRWFVRNKEEAAAYAVKEQRDEQH